MQVVFTSDRSVNRAGFVAAWSVAQSRELCADCPAGKYSEASGSSSCIYCQSGSFQDATGATLCASCEAGKFSILRYQHHFNLEDRMCPSSVNYYTDMVGYYAYLREWNGKPAYSQANSDSPYLLYYVPDDGTGKWYFGRVLGSQTGSVHAVSSAADVSGINAANTTWYSSSCGDDIKPIMEVYVSSVLGLTSCSSCGAGTYAEDPGSSACSDCPAGTFQNATGATSLASCAPCIDSTDSPPGSSRCVCKAGSWGDSISGCTSCIDNADSPAGSASISACVCKAGFYGDGVTSCAACIDNADSPAGSASISGCVCKAGFFSDGVSNCQECAAGTSAGDRYLSISSGSCESSLAFKIETVAECEQAAAALGLADTSVYEMNHGLRPPGCIYESQSLAGMIDWLSYSTLSDAEASACG